MAVATMEHRERLHVKWLMMVVLFAACISDHSSTGKVEWHDEATIALKNEGGIFKVNNQPFSGIIYRLAENKKDTVAVASFVNGTEDGEWRSYYSNGQLQERRYYSDGKKTDIYEGWWPNGNKRLLYHFENGEYEGSCIDWNVSGKLASSMNYKNGYEDGSQQQFYENGKVKANYVMIDGRRYGLLGTKNCVNVSDSVFKK
jgi:antitoxin component YwqK of YwqJK toxin-antitoxin module